MSKCEFCNTEEKAWDKPVVAHLVVTKNIDDEHIHTHGPLEKKGLMKELVQAAAEEVGLTLNAPAKPLSDLKEVVFHNRQRIGDMLVFTCAIRDFKKQFPNVKVNVVSTAMHVWDHNPYISREVKSADGQPNFIKIGPSRLTNSSNRLDWHFCNAYRVSIEDALHVNIQQGESRPDIWLTQEEWDAKPIFEKPYWIICTSGEKGWGCKMYPHVKWQEVVNQNPDLLFVQIGSKGDNATRLVGNNVIDYIGKTEDRQTGIRDLFKLFLNAEGSIGLVSFHMHLSGALHKPAVIIAGAREPVHFTRYPGHQYLATDGCLPCGVTACWHCNIDTCTNLVTDTGEKVPKCVDMIDSEEVSRAINNYYKGGRLVKGKFSERPKQFKNIVPTPPKVEIIVEEEKKEDPNREIYGMKFGGGSLTERDWNFIVQTILEYNIQSVLEFGAGLSTLLFNDTLNDVITLETNEGWIKKIKGINPKCEILSWDGITPHVNCKFDLCFVDGPAGDKPREYSTKKASELADIIIIHDAGREWARKYQAQYLEGKFIGPGKGGHRCHLWVNPNRKKGEQVLKPCEITHTLDEKSFLDGKPLAEALPFNTDSSTSMPAELSNIKTYATSSKFIKVISTARGWGGCARSVTTIMKMLLDAGHRVEFIPFRNKVSSKEYLEFMKGPGKDIIVTENYSTLNEYCDSVLMYADDYIWEFGKPELADAFENIHSARKIMMLNYRRGKVGEIPWTQGWDKYMFLNSTQESELLKVLPGASTRVLPPCTLLAPFLEVTPDYNQSLRIVRHSSQGDTKFPKDVQTEIEQILHAGNHMSSTVKMLPGPSFVPDLDFGRFSKVLRTADPKVIAQFLATGNLFWYSLPVGYMDMGPRTVVEAMAAGLPVIADNWGGAKDRVTPETGWLVNSKEEQYEIVKNLTYIDLRKRGQAARERAVENFRPEVWIEEIIGG